MDALVMCGGEGTRLADSLGTTTAPEKPLYPVHGKPMVDRVLDALDASEVDRIHAAVSPATPETREHIAERVSVIETPGEGYVTDLTTALEEIDRPVLTVTADLPLLTGPLVDGVLDAYAAAGPDGGSMTVAVPATRKDRLGVSADTVMETDAVTSELVDGRADDESTPNRIAPTGLNVVGVPTDTNTDTMHQNTMYLTDDERLAVNVNRAGDARVAEAML